jgi:LysR family nitrogen assimilation transcriptional regulator
MDPKILDYFLRVTELGSINRAASELGLSQPSLSRWLTLLERDVGTPLLTRTSRGVRATDAGEQLAERARPILRQLDLLRDEISHEAVTQVALGMPSALQHLVTAPFVAQVVRDYPNANLRLHEGINNSIRTLMENGSVDIGMMTSAERPPESFDTRPLVRERLMLVGPPSDRLDTRRDVPAGELRHFELVLPGRPNMIRAEIESAIAQSGGTFRRHIEAETLSLCLELARQELGHTVMPYSAIHARLADDTSLIAVPIAGVDLTWAICVNRTRLHTVTVQRIVAALRDFVTTRITAGTWPHARLIGQDSPET